MAHRVPSSSPRHTFSHVSSQMFPLAPAHCRKARPVVHSSHTRHALLRLTHAHPRGTPNSKDVARTIDALNDQMNARIVNGAVRCFFLSLTPIFRICHSLILPRYHRHFFLLSLKPAMTPAVRRPIQTLTMRGLTFFSFSLTPIFPICHTAFVLYITDIFFQCEV